VSSRLPGPRYSAHPDPIRELNKQNEIHLTVKCIALHRRDIVPRNIFFTLLLCSENYYTNIKYLQYKLLTRMSVIEEVKLHITV